MVIKNEELWKKVLEQRRELVPKEYYPYKTGPVFGSYIAEDIEKKRQAHSVVAEVVDEVTDLATKALGRTTDNKSAAMCEVTLDGEKKLKVYFCFFDNKRVVSTEIRSENSPVQVP